MHLKLLGRPHVTFENAGSELITAMVICKCVPKNYDLGLFSYDTLTHQRVSSLGCDSCVDSHAAKVCGKTGPIFSTVQVTVVLSGSQGAFIPRKVQHKILYIYK